MNQTRELTEPEVIETEPEGKNLTEETANLTKVILTHWKTTN